MMVAQPEKVQLGKTIADLWLQLTNSLPSGWTILQRLEVHSTASTLKRQVWETLFTNRHSHIFSKGDPLSLIRQIKSKGMKTGVAISPDTASSAITDEIGQAADMLLVMTVYPGLHGSQ